MVELIAKSHEKPTLRRAMRVINTEHLKALVQGQIPRVRTECLDECVFARIQAACDAL